MSELLEFALGCLFDLFCSLLEGWVGWRFFLSLLASIAVVVLLGLYSSDWNGCTAASLLVLVVGAVTGIAWELSAG
ncbi:MAG TPA: hypothetical protein VJA21_08505 [Verrucomicrobiae bacterium]